MIYLTIYILIAATAFGLRTHPVKGQQLYPFLLILLFMFSAFRWEIGCDWQNYINQYSYGQAFEAAPSRIRDPLWWASLRFLGQAGLPYPWLNVITSAIFFTGVHILARRQPDRLAFLVLLFPILIIGLPMSGIRQAAALGILLIAFVAFAEGRLFRFTVLVVLASTIHSSAMVFLLLVPLVSRSYSRTRIFLAAVLAIPGAALIAGSSAGEVALDRYVDTGIDAAGAVFRVGLLALTGVAYLVLLRRPWLNSTATDYKLVSIGSLGMIGIAFLLPLSTVIADRLAYYFVPIQAVVFARIPFLQLGPRKTLFTFAAYAALGITLAVWVTFSSHYAKCYDPYKTWLVGEPASRYVGR